MENYRSIKTTTLIEVFKTDVIHQDHADMLVQEINSTFKGYQANFDLDDCDKILRVKSLSESIVPGKLMLLLSKYGFKSEVLTDY